MSDDRAKLDWANLPVDVEAISLWPTLHDGEIRVIRSDRLARTMLLEIGVPHICHHHGLAEEAFTVELDGVQSARATTWVIWPGPQPDTQGMSRAEEGRLVEEYQSKGREESVGWPQFEEMVASSPFQIGNVDAFRADQAVGLRVEGWIEGGPFEGQFFKFNLRASRLAARHGEATPLDFERFVELGEGYWEAWSQHRT